MRFPFAAAVFFLLSLARSFALIVYDADETANIVAPAGGAPWEYVARLDVAGVADASGVYLGNNFVLTAGHVNIPTSVVLGSGTFARDTSYTPLLIGTADLKLIKILGDPGLAALPLVLPPDDDLGTASTLIGWGVGKGSEVTDQGWNWGGSGTRVERWGTSVTDASTTDLNYTVGANTYDYTGITTLFDRSLGEDTASLTLGDSGGALFQNFGGTWKLAGLATAVDTDGSSFYDNDTMTLGDQPDASYFVRIKNYRTDINAAIPEPSSVLLLLAGAALLAQRRPRRL